MPRVVEIKLPTRQTEALVEELKTFEGVIGLRVHRASSIRPLGDVVTVETTNRSLHELMRMLHERRIGRTDESSITTSVPLSIVSPEAAESVASDTSEATWEEIDSILARESNMTINAMLVMVMAGVLAAAGIATGSLHVVIGAMVIAPGFEPITRIGLGIVAKGSSGKLGLLYTARTYAALVAGAAATTALLHATGADVLGAGDAYVASQPLIEYWTSITLASVLISAAAGVAGAILIAVNRSLLTGGVMIALALIPSASLVGIALVLGEWALGGMAALRWLVDVALVASLSLAVFAWKRARIHKREIMS